MLTDTAARKAKPKAKPYKLTDTAALYLEVMPTGAKYWRMQYRHGGKHKRLALGVYPEVTLADARAKRDAARAIIREGRDPSAERKAVKAREVLDIGNTFGAIATEWLSKQAATMSDATMRKAQWMMALSRPLDALPLLSVSAMDVLAVLRKIEAAGNHETAHRVKQRIGQVFRYAVATGRASRDPVADLRGALAPPVRTSRAAVTDPGKVADLLRAIADYQGQFATSCALKLAPLVFVRPGELRRAEWAEFDLDAAEWRIPAHKMKMREAHTVPLAAQALTILHDLHPLTGRGRYLFPGLRTADRPMSENTINAALRRLGFDKQTMTGHGFRAMASTRLNEMGWAPDVIERQLAHAERNKVRAAYNRAQHMAERRKMMTAWADYLDNLRDGVTNVVPIKRARP